MTKEASKKQAERQRKLRAERKAAGLCVQCGNSPPSGVVKAGPHAGKPSLKCDDCSEKVRINSLRHREKTGLRPPGKIVGRNEGDGDHPFTLTGKYYRVKETGHIGAIVPCPCPDPMILEFKGGKRDAYHVKECEETKHATDVDHEMLAGIVPILRYLQKIAQFNRRVGL